MKRWQKKLAMRFKLIITSMLFLLPQAHAAEANKQAPATSIDFIELLGELGDEDAESLDAALTEIEMKKHQLNSEQIKANSQETKK
jgi:hypothetical protein